MADEALVAYWHFFRHGVHARWSPFIGAKRKLSATNNLAYSIPTYRDLMPHQEPMI
jgi:hypothetical protein